MMTSRLLVGIDHLDYFKHGPRRLQSFEQLLGQDSQLTGHVEMLQVVVPREGTGVAVYLSLMEEIHRLIRRINTSFGSSHWTPVRCAVQLLSTSALEIFAQSAHITLLPVDRQPTDDAASEAASSLKDRDAERLTSGGVRRAKREPRAVILHKASIPHLTDATRAALALAEDSAPATDSPINCGHLARVFEVVHVSGGLFGDDKAAGKVTREILMNGCKLPIAFVYDMHAICGPGRVARDCERQMVELVHDLLLRSVIDMDMWVSSIDEH